MVNIVSNGSGGSNGCSGSGSSNGCNRSTGSSSSDSSSGSNCTAGSNCTSGSNGLNGFSGSGLLVLMVSMVLVALELNFHSIEILVEKHLKVQWISLVEFSSREIFITTCMCMLNILFCLI